MLLSEIRLDSKDLMKMSLFRGVDPNPVLELLQGCRVLELEPDEVLLWPGQANETLYLVMEGRMQVFLDQAEGLHISSLGPGECAGEMSIIERSRTSAAVVAQERTRLLSVPQDLLWSLVDTTHAVAHNLLYILSGRLRRGNVVVAEGFEERRRFERFATEDKLTGLKNRRWFDESLTGFLASGATEETGFSMIMLDLDHFKLFNDRCGHPAGDRALQRVAQVIRNNLRPHDAAARYGGEEFAILMPRTRTEQAMEVAERLRLAVCRAELKDLDGRELPGVTISLGVAEHGPHDTAESLVRKADQALYRAKNLGRNRVAG